MKKLIITVCLISSMLNMNAQRLVNKYIVTLDTIQHINWPVNFSPEEASARGMVEYPYYWTDRVVWEYDLNKMTATWKGGDRVEVYKIYSINKSRYFISIAVGDDTQVGWRVKLEEQDNGKYTMTSRNVELVDGKADGFFSLNTIVVTK